MSSQVQVFVVLFFHFVEQSYYNRGLFHLDYMVVLLKSCSLL